MLTHEKEVLPPMERSELRRLVSPETEAEYATMRVLGRTTVGRSFPLRFGSRDDVGAPTRTVWQVISEEADGQSGALGDIEETTLHTSPTGRVQVKARVVRDQGRVAEVRFERVTGRMNDDAKLETLLTLDESASARLIELCLLLRGVDPTGAETLKLDEDLLAAVLRDPEALRTAYARDSAGFADLIRADVSARDVIAIAARREALDRFETLLRDPDAFRQEQAHGTREAVWQRFFEENPWVLGVGLSGHLLTSWDREKLERIVGGATVGDVGKRLDALLTTSGVVRSMVLVEIKLHDDRLLEREPYRPGCYAPSRAVYGGAAQAQVTAERARDDLGSWLAGRDGDGFRTGEEIYAGAPRSYLVVGQLSSFMRDGALHPDMVRSFELYRRHMNYPEVLTYDEVLARARWSLAALEDDD